MIDGMGFVSWGVEMEEVRKKERDMECEKRKGDAVVCRDRRDKPIWGRVGAREMPGTDPADLDEARVHPHFKFVGSSKHLSSTNLTAFVAGDGKEAYELDHRLSVW
jgi:hypothetical protein